mgnify:CR=1 FL=1|tara:strand:- start:221 stop:538 length:318 start_codon:yes stop_codon:yes gene_type:complete
MTDKTPPAPGPTTVAGEVSQLWLLAWQRELGPDATLTSDEQTRLHQLLNAAPTPPDLVTAAREYLEAADDFVDTTAADEWLRAERIMAGKRANFEQALSAIGKKA